MVLKLYGFPQGHSKIPALVLHELGIPFEFVNLYAPGKGEVEFKSAEHEKNHPFGQAPWINDDGFVLYESRAISFYLAKKYPSSTGGPRLLPPTESDIQTQALYMQALSVENNDFNVYARQMTRAYFLRKLRGEPVDQASYDDGFQKVKPGLDVLDKTLAVQKWAAGEEITIVDFCYAPYIQLLLTCPGDPIDLRNRKNVARWWEEISARESMIKLKEGIVELK